MDDGYGYKLLAMAIIDRAARDYCAYLHQLRSPNINKAKRKELEKKIDEIIMFTRDPLWDELTEIDPEKFLYELNGRVNTRAH